VSHSQEEHIAAQALKALHLRRQLERGDLTHEQYLDRLNAFQKAPEQPAATEALMTGPPPKLANAFEVLHHGHRPDTAELSPKDYVQQPAPVQWKAPAVVLTPGIPERSLAMNCPQCTANLRIYDRITEVECGECGAQLVVERIDCTIALRQIKESIEVPAAAAVPAAKRDEELQKLRAEAAMVSNVKRSAGILGGICAVGFVYEGIADLAARNIVSGAGILIGGGALLAAVICITRHTSRAGADLAARMRAITATEE
jgi:hypothetical protein